MESKEMRRLTGKWSTGAGWPKRLEWVQIEQLRGWENEKVELRYPITAIVGENGVGKSTVLQCIASIYKSKPAKIAGRQRQPRRAVFASDHFPDTTWDKVKGEIRYQVRNGDRTPPLEGTLRKPGPRWRGYKDRPAREVVWMDLSRIQPMSGRPGYYKLANPQFKEKSAIDFDQDSRDRLSQITGREYDLAKIAYTDEDESRSIPVLGLSGNIFSGWHQGNGETILAELIQRMVPKYAIVLIDEIESSLHPRFQRRLMRDLARLALERELQIVLTTHSPFVLEELPPEARVQILQTSAGKKILYGITPEFAMSKMDDAPHHECELYVEDERAERMLLEILAEKCSNPDSVLRCRAVKYGAASVGQALGIMKHQNRFPRPTFVFLDGDQGESVGCLNLPGEEAPERVAFEALREKRWANVAARLKRPFSEVDDACSQASLLADHHDWIRYAANKLIVGSDQLWQVMCSEWATHCLTNAEASKITQPIEDSLQEALKQFQPPQVTFVAAREVRASRAKRPASSEPGLLFEQSQTGAGQE